MIWVIFSRLLHTFDDGVAEAQRLEGEVSGAHGELRLMASSKMVLALSLMIWVIFSRLLQAFALRRLRPRDLSEVSTAKDDVEGFFGSDGPGDDLAGWCHASAISVALEGDEHHLRVLSEMCTGST